MMNVKTIEEKKRIFEVFVAICTAGLLLVLSGLETKLFSLSQTITENKEFFTTLAYFALININVILILFLSFLIFRNVTKLILERKRGILGSKLRTKLVFALVFFALAPTVLLFYVSMQFITTSFEKWFSDKVRVTMQQTREAGSHVYKQDQKRLESLARIALQRLEFLGPSEIFQNSSSGVDPGGLESFDHEYGINGVSLFSLNGRLLWSNHHDLIGLPEVPDRSLAEAIDFFLVNPYQMAMSRVVGEDEQDVVKGFAPVRDPVNKKLIAVLQTEVRFETQILKSVEKILKDFSNLKPGAQLIRLSYMILMIVMTLLIVFSATWLGFYVARAISDPLQSLAEATREIALGNYNINLNSRTDDETGQLVNAFNSMAEDLRINKRNTEAVQDDLRETNLELIKRRQYMETVLKNVSAGVIATDSNDRVTSINSAAEKLLKLHGHQVVSRTIGDAIGDELKGVLWEPLMKGLENKKSFRLHVDLSRTSHDVSLIVDITRIFDRSHYEIGKVIVFDDAKVQVMMQRVVAWREVARRIAHEIKNPITPIKLNAQRLLRRYHNMFSHEDQVVFDSCIETIITQVDSLRDLVNEFSKFSQMPDIRPTLASMSEIVGDALKLFRSSYPEILFKVQFDHATPDFQIDVEQMRRVFVNLISNSIAAFKDHIGSYIEIRTFYLEKLSTVRVEVVDNGVGVPKELRDRVLEPYFSTKDEGTGLGLAIAHQIITDHRGYLRITSNEPTGTVVIIELPIT